MKRLLNTLDETVKFYDLNLRPGCDSPALVNQLLEWADVVKLNEEELHRVHDYTRLPLSYETFCREAAVRYGWKAVAVTLGARGCAILANGHYVEAAGPAVDVADPVGAGDAFAAAFMHGLSSNWAACRNCSVCESCRRARREQGRRDPGLDVGRSGEAMKNDGVA